VEGDRGNREVPPGDEAETSEESTPDEAVAEVEEPPTPEPPPEGEDET
jgi:hypothetical protein